MLTPTRTAYFSNQLVTQYPPSQRRCDHLCGQKWPMPWMSLSPMASSSNWLQSRAHMCPLHAHITHPLCATLSTIATFVFHCAYTQPSCAAQAISMHHTAHCYLSCSHYLMCSHFILHFSIY